MVALYIFPLFPSPFVCSLGLNIENNADLCEEKVRSIGNDSPNLEPTL